MKMIEVLQLMSEGKIKDKTILEVLDNTGKTMRTYEYDANALSENFYDECDDALTDDYDFNIEFLNLNVKLTDPKPKKYYLKLFEDDECSYVHYYYDKETDSVDYLIGAKASIDNYQMTFNEKEIETNKLLTFIAKHGVKQEIER